MRRGTEKAEHQDDLILFGYTEGGDTVCVVYEEVDKVTIYPVTAYILED